MSVKPTWVDKSIFTQYVEHFLDKLPKEHELSSPMGSLGGFRQDWERFYLFIYIYFFFFRQGVCDSETMHFGRASMILTSVIPHSTQIQPHSCGLFWFE